MKLRDYRELKFPLSVTGRERLKTCDERLQYIVRELSMVMDITVIEGHRSVARQDALFNAGANALRTRLNYGRCIGIYHARATMPCMRKLRRLPMPLELKPDGVVTGTVTAISRIRNLMTLFT